MPDPSPEEIAEQRIDQERSAQTGTLDLGDLGLRVLPPSAFALRHLRHLKISTPYSNKQFSFGDARKLATFTHLEELQASNTDLEDLGPLGAMPALRVLQLRQTQVRDLRPLAGLSRLHTLNCDFTKVESLAPLQTLTALTDLSAVANKITDLAPLRTLSALTRLDCGGTQVGEIGPLDFLLNLEMLMLWGTPVSDLSPLRPLPSLRYLSLFNSSVADLAPLSSLVQLQYLDCSRTKVTNLHPLVGLKRLYRLGFSGCELQELPRDLVASPELKILVLHNATVKGVPPQLLSTKPDENCLPAIRAHFEDVAQDAAPLADIRILLLGNGKVGKTQIANLLSGQPYDPEWNSTHGIQLGTTDLGTDPPATLQIWDFGGQEIYHGTHALFLSEPSVLALVFSRDREEEPTYHHAGLTFSNQPLAYWLALVRQHAHKASPLIVIQNKCDKPADEWHAHPAPEALEGHSMALVRRVSAARGRGRAALLEAIGDAVEHLRDPAQLGPAQIGAGRLRVQRRLEAMRAAPNPPRWIDRAQFDALCREEGDVSDPAALLAYLNRSGVIFKPGLAGERIILDRNWALDAIYTLFNREKVYRELKRLGGRFTRSLLQSIVWHDQDDAEADLLVSLMLSSGICFEYRRFGEAVEYIAPALLGDRADIEARLAERWNEAAPSQAARFRLDVLHDGFIRMMMTRVGQRAGADALYWRQGFCGFEAETGGRFLVEAEPGEGWSGALAVRTQAGDAGRLLDYLCGLAEELQAACGMRVARADRVEVRPEPALDHPRFVQEKPARREWFVSFAWGDETPAGRERDRVVTDLIERARASGQVILRDTDFLGLGDSITEGMRRIGAGDRIFIILSERYLRSPYCMFELSEIWRNCRQDKAELRQRVRVYAINDVKFRTWEERKPHAIYWKEKFDAINADVQRYGLSVLGEAGARDHRLMDYFYREVNDILALFADWVLPLTLDDLARAGFRA